MKKLFATLVGITLSFYCLAAIAATVPDTGVTLNCVNQPVEKVLKEIEKQSGVNIIYKSEIAKKWPKITLKTDGSSVSEVIKEVAQKIGEPYNIKNNIVTIGREKSKRVTGNITGTVVDEEGEPVIGATISVTGSATGTITNADGNFSIKVNAEDPTLSVNYIGMKPFSTLLTETDVKDPLKIKLYINSTMMSEVVVTGYQEVKKEKMTGSVATISADKLEDRYTPNLIENLEGRVAGLSTYGGSPIIRGTGTLHNSTTPLLVVDGLPIEGYMSDINPSDIESINVLKDAAASAIYGARAANGIIVVTTKNAKKKGKIDIDFSANMTWYENRNMDYHDNFYMNTEEHIKAECEYLDYQYFTRNENHNPDDVISSTEYYINQGWMVPSPIEYSYLQLAKGEITRADLNSRIAELSKNNYAQDYADAVYRRQFIQQYNLALRSASDKSRNNMVVNYMHDNSGIINHKDERLNISYKGSYDIASWLTATVSINSVISNTRSYGEDYNRNAVNPWAFAPYQPFYNADGTRHRTYGYLCGNEWFDAGDAFYDLSEDPVEEMYNNTQTTKRQNMRYHGDLLFKIIPGLTANAQFIYESEMVSKNLLATQQSHMARMLRNAYTVSDGYGDYEYLIPKEGGFLKTTESNGQYWTARGQLNYSRTFGKHDIAAIAGFEIRETTYKGTKSLTLGYDDQLQSSATQTVDFGYLSTMESNYDYPVSWGMFPSKQVAWPTISSGLGIIPEDHHRFASGYANATYTFDEKYNVFGSFRKDYADVFGLNAKFRGKPLWSVGAGWNIHNESFMQNQRSWVSFLKFRFSYGVTGNIYQGATSVQTAATGYINSYTRLPYSEIYNPANPYLKWEQNRTTNVGIDFSLFNYRLRGTIDYYNKVGKDIFSHINLDPTYGFTSMTANAASIRNRGIEVSVAYDWFVPGARRDFSWTTSVTFSHNKNVVTAVENDATNASELTNTPYKVGYPVNALWSYRFAKISDEPGNEGCTMFYGNNDALVYTPSNQSVETAEFSGQTDPKYIVGMENTWKWNGLSLGFNMVYYGGHHMRGIAYYDFTGYNQPIPSYFVNSWTPENHTDMPGMGRYTGYGNPLYIQKANRSVCDASFIKIRNISLGYTLPEKWTRKFGINLLTLRFQVNNPKAIWVANKMGIDPETGGRRSLSSYVVGLNLNI